MANIACMPLKENVPDPKHQDWKPTVCPMCGRECWESEPLRVMKRLYPETVAVCTECALQRAMEKGKENL